jgi:hypothetical protein
MVMGKRSVIVVMVCASVILAGYSVSGYCQVSANTPQEPAVQLPPIDQRPPVSPRQLRLGLELVADLSVDPPTYTGSCPGSFTLKGQISVNKPITVHYRFIGANLPPSLTKTLTFDGPGRKEVTEVRQVGKAGSSPTFRATAVLQVVWPAKADSNVVDFSGTCTNAGQGLTTGSPSKQSGKELQPDPGHLSGPQPGAQGPATIGSPTFPMGPQGPLPGAIPLPQPGSKGEETQGVSPVPETGSLQGPALTEMPGPGMIPKAPEPGSLPLPSIDPDGRPVK